MTPDGSRLYANSEVFTWREGTVSAYSFDRASETLSYLNKQPSLGSITAHNTITQDGTKLLVANYGMGEGGPDRAVAVIAGDCGLLFTVQELATAVEQRLPLAIVLWDNSCLAEIRDGMAVRGIPEIGVHPRNPDFIKLADSFGCATAEPQNAAALEAAVRAALEASGPTLIRLEEAQVMTWTA